MHRFVRPELLDSLPHDDAEAARSRRDLRRINALMGNLRWIKRRLARFRHGEVFELGSGDGRLLADLARGGAAATGLDFAPRPHALPAEARWLQGDIFDTLPEAAAQEGSVIIANLFLHHLEDTQLEHLGALGRSAHAWCVVEPLRRWHSLCGGYALWPFVNRVTRHDMMISVRAGFVPGELPRRLGLDPEEWVLREASTLRGGYRLLAQRRHV